MDKELIAELIKEFGLEATREILARVSYGESLDSAIQSVIE
jgi:hypothetical protein